MGGGQYGVEGGSADCGRMGMRSGGGILLRSSSALVSLAGRRVTGGMGAASSE